MEKKCGRNDPCSCGSGKKYKKCCGVKKKISARKATVISGKSSSSLLGRISLGGSAIATAKGDSNSLTNRISKNQNQ